MIYLEFKIGVCKIYISLLFISFLTAVLLIDKSGLILIGLSAVIAHEIGHLIIMLFCDNMPREIVFRPSGISIRKRTRIVGQKIELLTAAGGCMMNILLAGVFYFACLAGGYNEMFLIFSASNLLIMIFNLLPLKGLDGYDILFLSLMSFFDDSLCNIICRIVSFLFMAVLVCVIAVVTALFGVNYSLILCGIYIIIMMIINIRY